MAATPERRIADLERQVAELAGEVRDLREQAFVLRTLEEMWIRFRMDGGRPAAPGGPQRHLAALEGGRR
jgi:hypothetical protein